MRYQRDLQVRLRERYRRLYKTDDDVYQREAHYFLTFILGIPALRAIIETINRAEPDLDPDKWINEEFTGRSYDWPESEVGRAKVVWRLIEKFASGESTVLGVGHAFSYETNLSAIVRDVTEKAIEPFVEYLEERISSESDILYLLERVKRRIETYDRDDLYAAYTGDTQRGEYKYDHYVRKFLFDQGIDNPIAQPRSASGEADMISDLDSDDPLIEETKLYDGKNYNIAYVSKGLNQAVQYAQDYGKDSAHLAIINLSDQNLQLPSDDDQSIWPPRIHTSNVTVYMVAIRAKPLPSASKRSRQPTKTVARDELVSED